MKKFALWIALVTLICACSGDYETFGTSDYNKLADIAFVDQDGSSIVNTDRHSIEVTLSEREEAWDSVTIDFLDASHFAKIHLVESKFKEYPSDSASLDSLARKVAYAKESVGEGDKIRIPESGVVYVVVVSESGEPSIWQILFTVPGREAPDDDDEGADDDGDDGSGDDGDDDDGDGENPAGSSSSEKPSLSSSSSVLSSDVNFLVSFEKQLKQNRSGDTIYVKLEHGSELGNATLASYEIGENAKIEPDPESLKSWDEFESFTVTAEDGSKKVWTVSLSLAESDEKASSEKDLKSIQAKGEIAEATISESDSVITLHLASAEAASSVELETVLSDGASDNISGAVNVSAGFRLLIIAEDASTASWTVKADYPQPPRILSLSIGGKVAELDSVPDGNGYSYHFHVDSLKFREDLTKLTVTDLEVTEGAECDLEKGEAYDFSDNRKVVVSMGGQKQVYTVKAGYQIPGSDFNSWKGDDSQPDSLWSNANTILTTTSKYTSGSMVGAKMATGGVLSKMASGSIYTAVFNPKEVATISMASSKTWPDGNELIDFGRKFAARPEYVEIKFSYEGKGDSCDLYVVLENRTGDKNVNRTAFDVNKLVGSAWYRSTKDDNSGRKNPDVVSVSSSKDGNGMRTLRLKVTYGVPLKGSPIENSSVFVTKLQSTESKAVNNGLVQGTGDEPVTHVRVVFASSAAGNFYVGTKGATLVVDNMRLVY